VEPAESGSVELIARKNYFDVTILVLERLKPDAENSSVPTVSMVHDNGARTLGNNLTGDR